MPNFGHLNSLLAGLCLEDTSTNMPSTYTKLHYHLVFSTQNRIPWITDDWESRLHGFLNGCLRQAQCTPLEIGGASDHLHILVGMKPTHRVCDVVCDIKSGASRWIHETIRLDPFAWQEGYGAFSTSVYEDHRLREYIRNKKEHHRTRTFLDEYRALLDEAGIEWDPRYLA